MKSVSILTLLVLVLFLVVFETPLIEANEDECLKEFAPTEDEMPDIVACTVRVFPSLCYHNCRQMRGAKGGRCNEGEADLKCFCDYCSDEPILKLGAKSVGA